MSLGDAYQEDVDRALDAQAALPVDRVMPKPRGLWRTAADSLLGAGAKLQASALEVGNVIGPALALSADPSNAEALEAVKRAPDFRQTEQSKPFRDFERKLRPDPVTASKAEEVVYGATGAMATLVGSAVLGGVPGLAAAAGEQGFSAAEDLAQQGVDLKTRTAVGALTAGVTGVSALLPMAGPTLKATIGLYLAGGPGGFVAQQYATRKILEAADYATIAKQYDPLDPTGLLVSALIPAPFAAWGIRGNLKARKGAPAPAADVQSTTPTQPQDVVDAAMAHNLTLQRDIRESVEIAPRAGETVPIQSLAEFAQQRGTKPAAVVADGSDGFLGWLKQQGGVSSAEKFDITGEGSGISRGAIFKRAGLGLDELARRAEADGFLPPGSVASAMDNGGTRAMADLIQRAAGGERVLTAEQQMARAIEERTQAMTQERVGILEDRLRMLGEDPAPAKGDLDTLESYLAQHEDRLVGAMMEDIAAQQQALSVEAMVPSKQAKPEPVQVERAKLAMQDMQDSGKPLADFAAGAKLEPDVQNLLIGLAEAGKDAQRAARMLGDFTRAVEAQPGRKPVDIAADVVEASREGRTVTPEPQQAPASAGTPEKATAESIQSRIAELEAAAPDMVVRMSDDGKPVTLADEMARIRREAAEGTDTELGTNDAGLLKVAAECAMSVGQV